MTPLSRRSLVPALTIAGLAITAFLTFASCTSTAHDGPDAPHALATSIAPPPLDAPATIQMPGLHNVVTYAPNLVCGGVPEGAEGLRTLAAMGIKTIVTVDGAAPDVQGAAALGIRYVHLPIGYNGMDRARTLELARAIQDLPGPIYLHCHHGQHRSACALGAATVALGLNTPEQATERMKVSGTASSYKGLYGTVAATSRATAGELAAAGAAFPEVSKPSDLVGSMLEVDDVTATRSRCSP